MNTRVAVQMPARFARRLPAWNFAWVAVVLAAMVLAVDPLLWLINTWRDPAYESNGLIVAALVAMLGLWSFSSPIGHGARPIPAHALPLLFASALLRLAGQVTAINVLGALTLIVDLYAIAVLARLDQRQRAISPGWLALAFAFSLPLERILQRTLGHGLQQISADGACLLLSGIYENVACSGVRIMLAGRDVLVDLPCSGARTLLLTALGFALAAAVVRPTWRMAFAGALLTLLCAIAANIVRITVLATGIAFPDTLGGINVMAQPWHDTIGYAAMLLGLAALPLWMRFAGPPGVEPALGPPDMSHRSAAHRLLSADALRRYGSYERTVRRHAPVLGLAALALAVLIINLPRTAIDVARKDITISAPAWLLQHRAQDLPLAPTEASYFTAYGGAAVKAGYGASSLLLVRTTSPLRHLHAPDECLRGLGFTVSYAGLSFSPVETAHYHATAPDGSVYRIDVTFTSDKGHATGSIATAVWHWLRGEAQQWTTIQRISPMTQPLAEHRAFSAAALFSLGVEPEPVHGSNPDKVYLPDSAPPPTSTPDTSTTKG